MNGGVLAQSLATELVADPHPDRAEPVWADQDTVVGRDGLHDRLTALVSRLADAGVGPRTAVALQVGPSFTQLALPLAVWLLGAQVVLLDHRLTAAETEQLLDVTRPRFHVTGEPGADFQPERAATLTERPGHRPVDSDVCLVQFSSGSTGRAKAIGRDAASLRAEIDRYRALPDMPQSGEPLLLLCSATHTWGLVAGVLYGLAAGVTVVFGRSGQPSDVLRVATERRCRAVFGVPAHFALLGLPARRSELPPLRLAVSAGDLLDAATAERFTRNYGVPVGQVYGMTETGVIATNLTGDGGCAGHPAPGMRVRITDDELYVHLGRSPYLVDDGVGRFRDGWLRTFDRATVEPGGALRIQGRADSVVVVNGFKVDLIEIENVLLEHEDVTSAAVTFDGVTHAFVTVSARLSHVDLSNWCRERLSEFKVPRRIAVVGSLPRTPSGKLVRDHARIVEHTESEAA